LGVQLISASKLKGLILNATQPRGRPVGSTATTRKEPIKLRIDLDLLQELRSTGPGWQTRINDALRAQNNVWEAARAQAISSASAWAEILKILQAVECRSDFSSAEQAEIKSAYAKVRDAHLKHLAALDEANAKWQKLRAIRDASTSKISRP
jgi:hypothetical protein